MGKIDPQIEALLKELQRRGIPPVHTLSPAEARNTRNAVFMEFGGPPTPLPRVEDIMIPGPGAMIPARVYVPQGQEPFPVLVYFHGGGWVVGNLDTHDSVCRSLARATPCLVVSVDYRLAPEYRFPAAVEDAYAATWWIAQQAGRLQGDSGRVAVGGDSAGGNLATVVCHLSRDRGGPDLRYQLLIYPVTNLASFDTHSYRRHGQGYILTRDAMVYYRSHYLAAEADGRNPLASPLLAPDLSHLPPAFVLTAEYDVLTDEGKAYALGMKQAGVPVRELCVEGAIHAFFSLSGVLDLAREAVNTTAATLREALYP